MSKPWWDEFKSAFDEGVKQLAQDTIGDFLDSAKNVADEFVKSIKSDLEKWAKMLKDGEISRDDFKDLVEAKEALAEIHALTEAGIAATKVERFKSGLINLVSKTAVNILT